MKLLSLVFCFCSFSVYSVEDINLKAIKATISSASSNIPDLPLISKDGLNLSLRLCKSLLKCEDSKIYYLNKEGIEKEVDLKVEVKGPFNFERNVKIFIFANEGGAPYRRICTIEYSSLKFDNDVAVLSLHSGDEYCQGLDGVIKDYARYFDDNSKSFSATLKVENIYND